MKTNEREIRALDLLLRVARQKSEDAVEHANDLEAARRSAEASLDWLAQAERLELESAQPDDGAGLVGFGNFVAANRQRRRAIEATIATLGLKIEAARQALSEHYAETSKLEHLIELSRRDQGRRRTQEELAMFDEAARVNTARPARLSVTN